MSAEKELILGRINADDNAMFFLFPFYFYFVFNGLNLSFYETETFADCSNV
jgi:hypothetical protein